MTDKEIIIAEIERKIKTLSPFSHQGSDTCGKIVRQLKSLIDFINSLPEEPVSEDADNAARDYADKCGYDNDKQFMARQLCVEHFKAGAKWERNHIWHNASEEPTKNSLIIYKCNGKVPDIGRFSSVGLVNQKVFWDVYKYPNTFTIYDIEKWCYLNDILPKDD